MSHPYFSRVSLNDMEIRSATSDPRGVLAAPRGTTLFREDTGQTFQNVDGVTGWTIIAPSTPYLVGTGSPPVGYTSIQAAIDAAVADGHGLASPAVVLVRPGSYVENLVLAQGVFLQAVAPIPESVVLVGSVTCSLPAGVGTNNFTGISGFSIRPAVGDGLIFGGANYQELFLDVCQIDAGTGGSGHCINASNTGLDGTDGSQIIGNRLALFGNPDSTEPTVLVAGTSKVLLNDLFVAAANPAAVAFATLDSANVTVTTLQIFGGTNFADDDSQGPNTITRARILLFAPTVIAAIAAPASLALAQVIVVGAPGSFTGTGTLLFSGPVTFVSTVATLDPALTILHPPAQAQDTLYNPTAPAVAAWGGPGVPTTQEEAIDRLAIAVSGLLGGGIP